MSFYHKKVICAPVARGGVTLHCKQLHLPEKEPWHVLTSCACHSQVVNMATVLFLTVGSQDARVEAMLYSLADGPLAAALIAWQCSWVFSSPSHSISVLLHLLPGLALFVHRHMDAPLSAVGVVQHIASLLPHRAPAGCAPPADLAVRPRCLRRSSSEYILSSCLCIFQRTASLVLHCALRFARPRQTSRCAMAACAALCEVVLKPRFNLPALLPLLHCCIPAIAGGLCSPGRPCSATRMPVQP